MLIYFLVAISPLVISYFFPKLNIDNKVKKRYLIVCGIVLVLFIGLRSKYLGSEDSFSYYAHMQRAINCKTWDVFYNPSGFEFGFQVFLYLLSRVFPWAQTLFVVTGIIYVSSILHCIYKNSGNVVLSTVMYISLGLLQFQIQGMRQAIAISICIFSLEFIKKRKFIPFVLLMLLAFSFHRTAFLFAAIYFISYISYNWFNLLLLFVGSGIVINFTDALMVLGNDVFGTNYSKTIESGGFVATAIYILIVVFALVFYKKELHQKENKMPSTILYITLLGMVSYITRYFGIVIAERISFYFLFSQTILLPNSLTHVNREYKKAFTLVIYVLCVLLFLYRLQGNNFLPYKFFWNA